VLEALACNVPVLATPVGIAPQALENIPGAYCESFEPSAWRAALQPLLAQADPRIAGRERAQTHSTRAMAERMLAAWRSLG
jgi:glycosyltransferase involved in cell wall biosynthesis